MLVRRVSLAVAALLAVLVPAFAAPSADAQSWAGQGRAQGRVLDEEGEPITGATVTLEHEALGGGPPPVESDAKGRWALLGLATGRWSLTIEADGYDTSRGWVTVQGGPAPLTEVRMQPLSVVSMFLKTQVRSSLGSQNSAATRA